jgi:hypothetical protein
MRYFDLLEGQTKFHLSVAPQDQKICIRALRVATKILAERNLAHILDCEIRFSPDRSEYWRERDIIIIDSRRDAEHMVNSLLHEAGHRLQITSFSLLRNLKLIFAHFRGKLAPNDYSRQNHYELFAELFRLWSLNELSDEKSQWMTAVISKYT